MLFNCHDCAKTITTKMDCCPYCQTNTARIGVTVEAASREKDQDPAFSRLRALSRLVWQ